MQKILINILNDSDISIFIELNRELLIQISTIWINQEALLTANNIQRLFFLLKRNRHSINKTAIVNKQFYPNIFVRLKKIFPPFLLSKINRFSKI
jgi:hypothetical protein